jgi:hypothetical protein
VATTKQDIENWFNLALKDKATHMIVVCDTFEYEDYPVFVYPDEDVSQVVKKYDGRNMQRVMELYSMKLDKASQIAERRAFHYE